jgi:hypothetical protein
MRWFKQKIGMLSLKPNDPRLRSTRQYAKLSMSRPHFFVYEAETSSVKGMEVYDRFPLVLPFAVNLENGTFHGINFHHIPPDLRLVVFDRLMAASSRGFSEESRIRAEWQTLKALANHPVISQAVKCYRFDRVKSLYIRLSLEELLMSIFMPVEWFVDLKSGRTVNKSRVFAQINRNMR